MKENTLYMIPHECMVRDYYVKLYYLETLYTSRLLDNLEEMDKFLEIYNLPSLNHEEIENLSRPITRRLNQ